MHSPENPMFFNAGCLETSGSRSDKSFMVSNALTQGSDEARLVRILRVSLITAQVSAVVHTPSHHPKSIPTAPDCGVWQPDEACQRLRAFTRTSAKVLIISVIMESCEVVPGFFLPSATPSMAPVSYAHSPFLISQARSVKPCW